MKRSAPDGRVLSVTGTVSGREDALIRSACQACGLSASRFVALAAIAWASVVLEDEESRELIISASIERSR